MHTSTFLDTRSKIRTPPPPQVIVPHQKISIKSKIPSDCNLFCKEMLGDGEVFNEAIPGDCDVFCELVPSDCDVFCETFCFLPGISIKVHFLIKQQYQNYLSVHSEFLRIRIYCN